MRDKTIALFSSDAAEIADIIRSLRQELGSGELLTDADLEEFDIRVAYALELLGVTADAEDEDEYEDSEW